MKTNFNIHNTKLEVETKNKEFKKFLEERLKHFKTSNNSSNDLKVQAKFGKPNFNEEKFSRLGSGVKISENEIIYEKGPLKSKINLKNKIKIKAFLNPKKWKHYGRIAKKGKEQAWNEYYEYFLIRKAIQLPLMWKLQEKGFYPLHASAVEKNGEAHVFTGFGGVGKTTLGLYLAENGYKLMGDNFVFLKDGKVYPYPEMLRVTDFTLEKVSGLKETGRKVFGQKIVEMNSENIRTEPADLKNIYLLNRGDFSRKKIDNGLDTLLGLADNLKEFHTHHYTSLFSLISSQKLESREKIYKNALENSRINRLSYSKLENVKQMLSDEE